MYVANGTPVLIKGKRPLDLRALAWDGRRVLGDGKTWEGFLGGSALGTLFGLLEARLWPSLMTATLAVLLAFGALLGDLVAAFFKRRAGLDRGAPVPLLDQLDFVIGGLLLAMAGGFYFSLETTLAIIVITPFLHLMTNYAAYLLGLKQVPW